MVKWTIVLFLVFAFVCFTKSTASSDDSPTEKRLLNGFPAAIWCKTAWDHQTGEEPGECETAQCEITKDGVLIYNESFLWEEVLTKGYLFNVSSEWNNSNLSVSLTLVNVTYAKSFACIVEEPVSAEFKHKDWLVGEKHEIECSVPRGMKDSVTHRLQEYMSEDQFNSIKAVWRKDGRIISTGQHFHLVPGNYTEGTFGGLKIPSPSFQTTPGSYRCDLKYGKLQLTVHEEKYCIREADNSNQPHITPQQHTYIVAPGNNVTVSCYGGGREAHNGLILWKRNSTRVCRSPTMKPSPCSVVSEIAKFCQPTTMEEISKFRLAKKSDFTAYYTLKNVSYENSGTYTCTFKGIQNPVSAQFIIEVREPPKARGIIKVVVIVFGILAMLFLICVLYFWKRMEINYFRKKFEKYTETDRPVTFLVYSDDVFNENVHSNALSDVTQWMKAQGYEYYNPSEGKTCLDAGEHVIEHSLEVLQRCLSMTVILSPKLLSENTLEVFKIYTGFEDNVKRNFPIIFICTKKIEQLIFSNSSTKQQQLERGENVEVVKTLRHFMKRNKDTTIHWKPGGSSKFYRRLYVALPKARTKNQITRRYAKGCEE